MNINFITLSNVNDTNFEILNGIHNSQMNFSDFIDAFVGILAIINIYAIISLQITKSEDTMKNRISLLLIIVIIISTLAILSSCTPKDNPYMTPPTINGVSLSEYNIVYDEQGLDYNKRAAEYIKNTSKERYGIDLVVVDDDTAQSSHEIVVGETSRPISASLNAETTGLEFALLAQGGSIALEGDYRVLPGHNRETTLERERTRNWYIRRMVK